MFTVLFKFNGEVLSFINSKSAAVVFYPPIGSIVELGEKVAEGSGLIFVVSSAKTILDPGEVTVEIELQDSAHAGLLPAGATFA